MRSAAPPRELLDLGNPLEIARTAVADERRAAHRRLGSSSTQGYGASNPQFAYPAQLKMRLDNGDAGHRTSMSSTRASAARMPTR